MAKSKQLIDTKDYKVEETDSNIVITVPKEHFEKCAPKGTKEALEFVKVYGQEFIDKAGQFYTDNPNKEISGTCYLGFDDEDILELGTVDNNGEKIFGTQTVPTYLQYDLSVFEDIGSDETEEDEK